MIDVKVSYQGPFLDITRKREEQVRLERPQVRDLIEILGGCYGERFKGLLIDPRSPGKVLITGLGPLGATGLGLGSKMKWTFKSP